MDTTLSLERGGDFLTVNSTIERKQLFLSICWCGVVCLVYGLTLTTGAEEKTKLKKYN
jgi:hypothetical protein